MRYFLYKISAKISEKLSASESDEPGACRETQKGGGETKRGGGKY